MQLLWMILVTFFAGMGAGLGTGFAGMSAAAVISLMLITFLHMDPDMPVFVLCVIFTLLWARIAAKFANKAEPKTLNRATGLVLVILGIVIMGFQVITK